MKMHNIVLIVLGIFLVFFLVFTWKHNLRISENRTNKEYSEIVATACHDAVKAVVPEGKGGIWREERDRVESLETFYTTLALSLNKPIGIVDDQSIAEYTPIIMLLDENGFYISYNACFDDFGNAIVPEDIEKIAVMSTLNTWTEGRNGYRVRYYLSDDVDVVTPTGNSFSGNRFEVYEACPVGELAYLADDEVFDEERIRVITDITEETLNYYLNTQCLSLYKYNTGYQVSLSRLRGESWNRMIEYPTFIAFVQGPQLEVNGDMFNVYAYAAGEVKVESGYIIKDGEYRPVRDYDKEEEGIAWGLYDSMEKCAARGAYPKPKE